MQMLVSQSYDVLLLPKLRLAIFSGPIRQYNACNEIKTSLGRKWKTFGKRF